MPDLIWAVPTGTDIPLYQGETVTPIQTIDNNWFIAVEANNRSQAATSYELWGGHLPQGLDLTQATYSPPGQPSRLAMNIYGTVAAVSKTTTSTFVIRAWSNTSTDTSYIDGTFSYTVFTTAPSWTTPEGNIANILTGNDPSNASSYFSSSINYIEPTLNSNVRITVDGAVPPGMLVDTEAASGNIGNNINNDIAVNVSGVPYYSLDSQYANIHAKDANANAFVKTYDFTLNLTDSEYSVNAAYAINVYAREFLTADMDLTWDQVSGNATQAQWFTFTADSDYTQPNYPQGFPQDDFTFPPYANVPPGNQFNFTSGVSSIYGPWIVTPPGHLANTVTLDFYAKKVEVVNLESLTLRYFLADFNPDGTQSRLPYGLVLDQYTGYIYGTSQSDFDTTYTFTIYTEDANDPAYSSKSVTYNLFIYNRSPLSIIWDTNANVGNINNGNQSEFYIQAHTQTNDQLYYVIVSGSLPPGLNLNENGLIVGRVIFDTPSPVYTYAFTVEARGVIRDISARQQFTITVNHVNTRPYNDYYIQAYGRAASRLAIQNILQDYSVMPIDQMYRFSDPDFGIATKLKFLQAVNIYAATDEQINSALTLNHYRKVVGLGPFKTAVARDNQGNIKYDVVYSPVLDDLVNSLGESVSLEVNLPYPVEEDNGTEITNVYPNSLEDMRRRLVAVLGQDETAALPGWMSSVQPDKSVLGFTAGWVICYALPGAGDGIAYRLNNKYGELIKTLDFDIDRYDLDARTTYRYNAGNDSWDSPVDTRSQVINRVGDVLTVSVYNYSTSPTLMLGDTITWTNSNNSLTTTSVLGISPWTPVYQVELTSPGRGYSQLLVPRVSIERPIQGGGKAAEANVTVLANGTISSNIELLNTGYGYHVPPRVTIEPPPDGNVANSATAVARIKVSPITGGVGATLIIDSPGDRYDTAPNIYIQQPTVDAINPNFNLADATATARATIVNGMISIAAITRYGQNYESTPYITVEPSQRGNTARLSTTIWYQIQVGDSGNFTVANPSGGIVGSNIWLFNTYAPGDELNKYYLFPRVNILE